MIPINVSFRMFVVTISIALASMSLTADETGTVKDGPPRNSAAARAPVQMSDLGKAIHSRGFVFDGHNDLPWAMRRLAGSSFDRVDIAKPQAKLMTDIPRLRKGNVGAQFWSVYVPANLGIRGTAYQTTMEQIQLVRTMCERYPDTFALATSVADIRAARKEGKIASLIGVEGGHSIENSIGNLRRLYDAGARYMTLTHSSNLDWADSATDDTRVGGLNAFGKDVVREMNRLGMLVDLSHVSPAVMKQALEISTAPVIYSHSSARAKTDHPRNVPDEMLPLIRQNGGVIMVNFYSGYVVPAATKWSERADEIYERTKRDNGGDEDAAMQKMRAWRTANPPPAGTVHDLVDHIDHLVDLCGIDHVGLGSDYDGVPKLPKQIEDVSTYPIITQALLDRGYTETQIHKIMSGNVMRAFAEAERVAQKPSS
ncbi:MAG: dipeptidase [Planctomycetota bacterium]